MKALFLSRNNFGYTETTAFLKTKIMNMVAFEFFQGKLETLCLKNLQKHIQPKQTYI